MMKKNTSKLDALTTSPVISAITLMRSASVLTRSERLKHFEKAKALHSV